MQKKKKTLAISAIVICLGLIGYSVYDQIVVEPVRKEVVVSVNRVMALQYGKVYLLDGKYQNKTEPVPTEVIKHKKDEIKTEIQSIFSSDFSGLNNQLESAYDWVDMQAKKRLIFPNERVCSVDRITYFSATEHTALIELYVNSSGAYIEIDNGRENVYYTESVSLKYQVSLVKIDDKWLVVDYDYIGPVG